MSNTSNGNPAPNDVTLVAGSDGTSARTIKTDSSGNLTLGASTVAIGKLAANSGVDIGDVDVLTLPALIAGSAIIGKVGIDQTTPGTTNNVNVTPPGLAGTSPSNDASAAAEASSVSKASAGTVYDFRANSTTAGYIQFHNSASLPADTAVPFLTYPIAANETIGDNFGIYGKRFSTGIVIAFSTTEQTLTIGGSVMLANVGYV